MPTDSGEPVGQRNELTKFATRNRKPRDTTLKAKQKKVAGRQYGVSAGRPKYLAPLKLPSQSPNLNAFAERWVRSIKDECFGQFILFGERLLRHVVAEYVAHYYHERNLQGFDNG